MDTDPENMLSEDESVRAFYHSVKKEFNLHNMLIWVEVLVRKTGLRHLDRQDYSLKSYYNEIDERLEPFLNEASDETYDTWSEIRTFMDEQSLSAQVFKNSEVLAYMEKL